MSDCLIDPDAPETPLILKPNRRKPVVILRRGGRFNIRGKGLGLRGLGEARCLSISDCSACCAMSWAHTSSKPIIPRTHGPGTNTTFKHAHGNCTDCSYCDARLIGIIMCFDSPGGIATRHNLRLEGLLRVLAHSTGSGLCQLSSAALSSYPQRHSAAESWWAEVAATKCLYV